MSEELRELIKPSAFSAFYGDQSAQLEMEKTFINTYLYQLKEDVYYETAFKKIGIYSENEIDIISLYSSQKQQFIGYLERLLIRFNRALTLLNQESSERDKDFAEKQFRNILSITLFSLLATKSLGMLSLCQLSKYSTLEKQRKYQEDFKLFFKHLTELNNLTQLNNLMGNIAFCNDFIERLKLIKNKYQSFSKDENLIDCYYCLVRFDLHKINEIMEKSIFGDQINNSRCILVFGDSETDVKNDAKKKLKFIFENSLYFYYQQDKIDQEDKIDRLIKELETSIENISPWSENIA